MEHRYILLRNDFGSHIGYGIAAVADYDSHITVLQAYTDLACDKDAVSELVDLCNRLEASLCHFKDIVEDFLAK